MKLGTVLKAGCPLAVKIIHRDSLFDNISQSVFGRDKIGTMRALAQGNMVYLQEVMTYWRRVYLAIELPMDDEFFK